MKLWRFLQIFAFALNLAFLIYQRYSLVCAEEISCLRSTQRAAQFACGDEVPVEHKSRALLDAELTSENSLLVPQIFW
jgi:hypothetical protein